jgi:hypothetical protein
VKLLTKICFETTTFSSSLAIRCTVDDVVEALKCKDADEHDPKKMLCQLIAKSSSNENVSMKISMQKNRKKNSQLKSKKIMVDYIFSLQVLFPLH